MPSLLYRFGMVGAIAVLLVSAGIYLSGIYFTSLWWLIAVIRIALFVFIVIYAVILVKKFRNLQEGTIFFTQVFGSSIVFFLITIIINIFFNLLIYNVFDKDYAEKQKSTTLKRIEKQLDHPYIEEATQIKILDALSDKDFGYSPHDAFRTFGRNVLFYSLISLIIAASMRKDVTLTTET